MRTRITDGLRGALCALSLAVLAGVPLASAAQTIHTLPFVVAGGVAGLEGVVRIGNRADRSGTVRIHAIDDDGTRFGPVTLSLDAHEAVTFNSRDLEGGNASKGLSGGVGDGEGNWRLELQTELDVTFSAYIRTADGFVTGMQDIAPEAAQTHRVLWFNPGSNTRQVSMLRLTNPGTEAATVGISARDDAGDEARRGAVSLSLPAGASRRLTAQQLESGGGGFTGSFGDGAGKWRLTVTASSPIEVVNLLRSPTGHLSNVSAVKLAEGERPLTPGTKFMDCPECPEMVVVPAGSFTMGSPESERGRFRNESPAHRVTIGRPFAAGVYQVTFDEWNACVSDEGCSSPVPGSPGVRFPMQNVNWVDAKAYVGWLSRKTGKEYRLLSESEWEYVARAGTTGPFHTGSTITPEQANYDGRYRYPPPGPRCVLGDECFDDEKGLYRDATLPVGSFSPNAFGLYDVHGNVWEWVEDCWNESYRGAPADGSAWESGDCGLRVFRGGTYFSRPEHVRSAVRGPEPPGNRGYDVGFRVARTLD